MGGCSSNSKSRALLLLCLLLQTIVLGIAKTKIYMKTPGVCVAFGDSIHLVCVLGEASNEDTQIAFFKGSMPLASNSRVHINNDHTELCREIGSNRKCDLRASLTVDDVSASDKGVYWCQATENNITIKANATVFVQSQSELELPANVMTVNLGDNITVPLDRKCDLYAPVQVTRTSRDGTVKELPYRHDHEEYQHAYVTKLEGALFIPGFNCTDEGNYTFTVIAGRNYKPVFTSKSIYINASCEGCCQGDAPVTSTTISLDTSSQAYTSREVTAEPSGNSDAIGMGTGNTANIVIIATLCVLVVAGPLGVHCWHRRKNRHSFSPERSAGADEEAPRLRLERMNSNDQ
ncbi:uncharacterized protein LOC119741817 [Patiria miniata]|uniref:Ig-like domain-containing protein n=1 Tax=Patiria miniata TaxID=46514 RepID=A0A914BC98_PATMI|nr:uncharacterized protein LOC119741817 [Patiria miniata]